MYEKRGWRGRLGEKIERKLTSHLCQETLLSSKYVSFLTGKRRTAKHDLALVRVGDLILRRTQKSYEMKRWNSGNEI